MWADPGMKWFTVFIGCFAFLVSSSGISEEHDTADWWKAQKEVSEILLTDGQPIADAVADISISKPENAQEALFKLCILMRAGMNEEAIRTLGELHTICPELHNYQIEGIYYFAYDDLAAWDVAQATVEIFAENISAMALENRLFKHFLSSGWTAENIDEWLSAMPPGQNGFWIKQRLRFNNIHGLGNKYMNQLVEQIKRDPNDMDGILTFLDGLIFARHTGDENWELSWMNESIRPHLATDSEEIASCLNTLKECETAIPFYTLAMDTPLTAEETRKLSMMCSIFVPEERLRAMFSVKVREGMSECLLEIGKKKEAQKWMVEAADIRKEHDLGLNALLSGIVQGKSGQHVIEGRIRDNETDLGNDPRYWRERAQYYRGREEPLKEEEALLKGLALTTTEYDSTSDRTGSVDWRGFILSDYAHFLERENREDEAAALLRNEIEYAPATSGAAEKAAHILAFDLHSKISVDDGILWTWLANRPTWRYTEQRLLWRMLERAEKDSLDRYYSRSEGLAYGHDPSRASTLGWIMNRMRDPERSIPLLTYAIEHAHDEDFIGNTQFTLFESYLDLNDWNRAEGIFPEAAKRLTPKELPEWYSRVAVSAARCGAPEEALRIWRQVANISPSWIRGLDDLAQAGLRDELIVFYREMQKEMPNSEFPGKAMEELMNDE